MMLGSHPEPDEAHTQHDEIPRLEPLPREILLGRERASRPYQ